MTLYNVQTQRICIGEASAGCDLQHPVWSSTDTPTGEQAKATLPKGSQVAATSNQERPCFFGSKDVKFPLSFLRKVPLHWHG